MESALSVLSGCVTNRVFTVMSNVYLKCNFLSSCNYCCVRLFPCRGALTVHSHSTLLVEIIVVIELRLLMSNILFVLLVDVS